MNKRISLLCTLLVMACMAFAAPAKPAWQKIVMADGSILTVMKCGDENFHYYKTDAGKLLIKDTDGSFREVDKEELITRANKAPRRAKAGKMMAQRKAAGIQKTTIPMAADGKVAKKKGLVIMVSFSDMDFRDDNAWTEWNDILNKTGYNGNGAPGCVNDYFLAQSNGQFDLSFDLVGPVKMPKTHYYYGDNGNDGGQDIHMGECVAEACRAVNDIVDFRDYDWDGDGHVEQVFILYAGCGENASGVVPEGLIWPHSYSLRGYYEYENGLKLDNVTVDVYACACELWGHEYDTYKRLSGFGTFCHEFSHNLGLPDFYDTYGDNGLDMLEEWDVMSLGCYNNYGWCPPNYSALEREFCGWQQPTLLTEPTSVKDIKSLQNGGETFRIDNDSRDGIKNEYYLIENRQKTGWDSYLPGKGLLITHVFFRQSDWDNNSVNTVYNTPGVAFIPANNVKESSPNVAWPYTDPNTGTVNDSLTNKSKPAARVFKSTVKKNRFMNKPISDIKVIDGIASFEFCKADDATGIESIETDLNGVYGRPVTIYDSQGRRIAKVEKFNGISTLPSGMYIITGEDGRSMKMTK